MSYSNARANAHLTPEERRRATGGSRRVAMVCATLAVAMAAGALLFVGTRVFGLEVAGQRAPAPQAAIGVAVEPVTAGYTVPQRSTQSESASPSAGPMTAKQPGIPSPSTAKPSPSKAKAQTGNAGMETQVVDIVNVERAKAGCGALTADAALTTAARGHSTDMATRNYFSHDTLGGGSFADRISKAGYKWSTAGENIAMGQPTAASVMSAWMNSAGHKANILNCSFKNIGVGLAYSSKKAPYWTQDFGAKR